MAVGRQGFSVVVAADEHPSSLAAFHKALTIFRHLPDTTFLIVHVRSAPGRGASLSRLQHSLADALSFKHKHPKGTASQQAPPYPDPPLSHARAEEGPPLISSTSSSSCSLSTVESSTVESQLAEPIPASSRAVLSRFAELAADEGVAYSVLSLIGDSPAAVLKQYCRTVDADVLVLATQKRFGKVSALPRPAFIWCHGEPMASLPHQSRGLPHPHPHLAA